MMDSDVLDIQPVSVVEAVTRGEIDVQISTAKRYPRDIEASRGAAMAMACVDEETAASCMYALPRGGKKLEGGSIRLAEIIASTYGNLRVQSRIIDDPVDRNHVTAMAGAWDLQSNTAVSIEKKRRATYSSGARFNDDMLITTQNANASIAYRDAVLKVVPRSFWWPIYEAARALAIGDASTLADRRFKLIEYFAKMGVFEDRLLASFGYESIEQIGLDDVAALVGTATLIREGTKTVDEAFPPTAKESASLADKIKAKKQPPTQAKPDAPAKEDVTADTGVTEPAVAQHQRSEVKSTAPPPAEPESTAEDTRDVQEVANSIIQKCKSLESLGVPDNPILRKCGIKSRLAVRECDSLTILKSADQALLDARVEADEKGGAS